MSAGIVLVIDGWGTSEAVHGNAFAAARTPALDRLQNTFPAHTLHASGRSVGLPSGVVGNSEIGHMVMGAGRPLEYDSLLVQQAIASGRLRSHPVLDGVCKDLVSRGTTLHLVGLCSDGMIHAESAHLVELAKAATEKGVSRVAVHAITDGRDVADHTAETHLANLERALSGAGRIRTVIGRNYAMDKSGRDDLTRQTARLVLDGEGRLRSSVGACAANDSAEQGDGWIPPSVIGTLDDTPKVVENDAILFTNFRSDRISPLVDVIADELFDRDIRLLSLTQYDTRADVECLVPRADASGGIADVLTRHGLRSARIAEREKFEHVTFYVNGRDPRARIGETHHRVAGPASTEYVENPEMNIDAVVETVTQEVADDSTALVIVNLANIDVVGHTGDYAATVRAVEAVDSAVERICSAAARADRWVLLVGDHGNGECMVRTDTDGSHVPFGGHTLNKVPCVLVPRSDENLRLSASEEAALPQIAPTICQLLDVPVSPQMSSHSLLLPAPA